jgi:hypothetical protein
MGIILSPSPRENPCPLEVKKTRKVKNYWKWVKCRFPNYI